MAIDQSQYNRMISGLDTGIEKAKSSGDSATLKALQASRDAYVGKYGADLGSTGGIVGGDGPTTYGYTKSYNPQSGTWDETITPEYYAQITKGTNLDPAMQGINLTNPTNNDFLNSQRSNINNMYANSKSAKLASLYNTRDTALSGLSNQDKVIGQQTYQAKNQATAANAQQLQRLREALASMGQGGGENITAQAQLGAAYQGNLGQIDQNKINLLADLESQRSNIRNTAATSEQGLISELEAAKNADLLSLDRYADERQRSLDEFGYQQTLDSINRQDRLNAVDYQKYLDEINRADTLAQQDFQNKLAQAQFDYAQDPTSLENQMKLLQLQQMQTENKYLPEKLRLDNLAAQSLINQRNSSNTSSSSGLKTSDINRVVSNISNVISQQVKSLGSNPTNNDLVQFVNELYPDLSSSDKSKVVRELQGKFGISPTQSTTGTASKLVGPINPEKLLNQGFLRSW